MSKRFHIGDVLTITTGVMVSPSGSPVLYDIMSYIAHEDPGPWATISLIFHAEPCKKHLLKQFPQLGEVDVGIFDGEVDEGQVMDWLAIQEEKYGKWFEVPRAENYP